MTLLLGVSKNWPPAVTGADIGIPILSTNFNLVRFYASRESPPGYVRSRDLSVEGGFMPVAFKA